MNETTTTDAAAIFAPLWKRKWLILVVGVIVAVGTYLYYEHRPRIYGAGTEVYLGGSTEVQSLLGGTPAPALTAAELADQAELINSNVIGEAVRRRLAERHRLAFASGTVKATPVKESDVIMLKSEARSAQGAAVLANTYAKVYLREREAEYRRQVEALIATTRRQLTAAGGTVKGATSRNLQSVALIERLNELKSELNVGKAGDRQINPAVPSALALSPKPKRNAIFGFVLGLLLAAFVAYALSRFDRRLRSLAAVEEALRTPVLTVLPSAGSPISRRDGMPAPAQPLREPLRRLHTTLQLQDLLKRDLGGSARSILFVSAEAGAGKSTTIAGLALVQREAGERVAIIDADLRRPTQAKLLGVEGVQGLTEVLAGELPMSEALQRVEFTPQSVVDPGSTGSAGGVATTLQTREMGLLSVLASGRHVANPPALLAGRGMSELLRSVTGDFDYVLVDAPPPLGVSDVMPLLHIVDAIVVVARVGQTTRAGAERLLQLLERSASAPVLGVVANDVPSTEIEAYGFSYAYYDKD